MKPHYSIDESIFKADFELLDRYIQFSSELLRISLIAMGGYGTLLMSSFKEIPKMSILSVSMIAFTICSTLTLFHRYYASDSMAWYISSIRKLQKNDLDGYRREKDSMKKLLSYSKYSLLYSGIMFGVGVVLFLIGLFVFMYN